MDFFYNKQKIDKYDSPELYVELTAPGVEVASILYEKLKNTAQLSISKIKGTKEDGTIFEQFFAIDNEKYFPISFSIDGSMRFELDKYSLERIQRRYGATNISVEENISLEELNKHINPNTFKKAEQIFNNFFIKEQELTIQDKYNKDYKLVIYSNSDMSIGENLYIDELMLFDGDKKIGYLKAKYTTNELNSLYPDTPNEEYFLNKATIDYSLLEDEYKNKGLGYVMYFYMAQHLNQKNIQFRQSTLCSDEAQLLWEGFNKNLPEFISKEKINKEFVNFLKIGQEQQLIFNNGKVSAIKKIKP